MYEYLHENKFQLHLNFSVEWGNISNNRTKCTHMAKLKPMIFQHKVRPAAHPVVAILLFLAHELRSDAFRMKSLLIVCN